MIKLKQEDPRYKIDTTRKVFVYKNLHKDCWSIKQDGLVKAHANDVTLYMCDMIVNYEGRQKVLRQKRKNVHAGIRGYMEHKDLEVWADLPDDQFSEITYNPYKYSSFVDIKDSSPRWFGSVAKLRHKQVLVA